MLGGSRGLSKWVDGKDILGHYVASGVLSMLTKSHCKIVPLYSPSTIMV